MMRRYIKSLVSTDDLVNFAERLGLRLGKTNPRRTINYYIRQGLLPPRLRTHDGKLNWGFPTYAKALLVRISKLKRLGLSLVEIKKKLEQEITRGHEEYKRPQYGLAGMEDAFSDPVYDYNYTHMQEEVKEALKCLQSGRVREAEEILRNLNTILEPPPANERHIVIADVGKRLRLIRVKVGGEARKKGAERTRKRRRRKV